MNPNDYDEDGNNIVPCPICMSNYCPSKENGKCPKEDEFIKDMSKEKSVEEIVEEFEPLLKLLDKADKLIKQEYRTGVSSRVLATHKLTQTLKAERQKRDEALEEAGNYVDELYQSGNMGKNEYELLPDFFDEKLTHPNNPK